MVLIVLHLEFTVSELVHALEGSMSERIRTEIETTRKIRLLWISQKLEKLTNTRLYREVKSNQD